MKKNIYRLFVLFLTLGLTSCSKWLDVKPEDRFIEEEMMQTEQGFADALNGIYTNIGASNMYGGNLNLTYLDILAQYYYISPSHSVTRQSLTQYNYSQENVMDLIDGIWSRHYTNITGVNKFLESLETYGSHLNEQSAALFRGEALGLRALLYFDLIRMFTPAYTVDSTAVVLPYYDKTGHEISEFRPSTFIMQKILSDLKSAEELLSLHDPALNETVIDKTTGSVEVGHRSWLTYRNYRLNYYAVKGLQARVNLWCGDKATALQAAKTVIDNQSKFPWITSSQINFAAYPNRIFSTELLFAVENRSLYTFYNNNFSSALEDNAILAAGTNSNFLNTIYENQEIDFRYSPSWNVEGGKTYRVFLKYRDLPTTALPNFRFTIPMIRLSEIYLIAAECEPVADIALEYLNTLRENRNLQTLSDPALLSEYILREYRKEFYGEGQLWFYYKRNSVASIISASTSGMVNINPDAYTFDIPLSETDPR